MGKLLLAMAAAAWICGFAQAQTFASATVRASAPVSQGGGRGTMEGGPGTSDPLRISYRGVTLRQVVMAAYGVRSLQIAGPDWFDGEGAARFDISAGAPSGTTAEPFKLMLQNLLAKRFKLTLHWAPKEFAVDELRVSDKGGKLKASAQGAGTMITGSRKGGIEIRSTGGTMKMLASALEAQLSGTAVIDKTGLEGNYDFTLLFASEAEGKKVPLPDLEMALELELGLKIEKTMAPLDVLVVDHAERP